MQPRTATSSAGDDLQCQCLQNSPLIFKTEVQPWTATSSAGDDLQCQRNMTFSRDGALGGIGVSLLEELAQETSAGTSGGGLTLSTRITFPAAEMKILPGVVSTDLPFHRVSRIVCSICSVHISN